MSREVDGPRQFLLLESRQHLSAPIHNPSPTSQQKGPCAFDIFISCFFAFLPTARANAQASAYGTLSVSNYGYSFNGNSLTISSDHVGFGFGALYDIRIAKRVTLGIDGRGNYTPNTTGGAKGFVSARAAFVPHENPLRPYFQVGVGEIHAKVPQSSFTVGAQSVNKFGIDLALGLDVRLNPSFDYRILELESGAGFNNNHGTNAGSASLSTGIVYHFPTARSRHS